MTKTPNHGYNVPNEGTEDWNVPLNENFKQHDTDIEIRDQAHTMGEYTPKDGAKFLATDTGNVFVGDGDQWSRLDTSVNSGPSGVLPASVPGRTVHGYAELRDSEGNLIRGSAEFDGRDGLVKVLRFDHTVQVPVDEEKGELLGMRRHRPLTFVKPLDSATPLLARVLTNGETLQEIKIHWYDEEDVEFFTHTLEEAKISEIRAFGSIPQEVVSVLYGEITWSVQDGNIEYTDSWTAER